MHVILMTSLFFNVQNTNVVLFDCYWLHYSFFLFILGVFGVFVRRKNVLILLMSLELMLLGININFICFSLFFDDLAGEMYALFLLTVGASESALGLAFIVAYYKNYENHVSFF